MLGEHGRVGVEVGMSHQCALGSTLTLKERSPLERIHHKSSSLSYTRGTGEESTSRGVRVLLKAKEFHAAARGRSETSGFRYLERRSRRRVRTGSAESVPSNSFLQDHPVNE